MFSSSLRRGVPALASLFASSAVLCDSKPPAITVREPYTSLEFPSTLAMPGPEQSPSQLAGVAVRCMMGWCRIPMARGYAFGLYVDPAGLEAVARKFPKGDTGASSDQSHVPSSQAAVYLLDEKSRHQHAINLSIRLALCRDVQGDHVAKGFGKTFAARLKSVGELASDSKVPMTPTGDEMAELETMVKSFRGLALKRDDVIRFDWSSDARVHVTLNDKELCAPITSPMLARAVFDAYIGESPVGGSGHEHFGSNLIGIAHVGASV